MLQRQLLVRFVMSLAIVGATGFAQADDKAALKKFSDEDVRFFEQDVLPVLKANCFKCHGGEPKVRGGFRLTSREGVLKGGELGVVVNVEQPADSILVKAINYAGDGLEMPPTGKLAREKIDVLTKWVQRGLPWSSTTADYGVEAEIEHDAKTSDSTYWAYQPIRRLDPPAVKRANWVRNPIDAFVLAKLEAAGLSPSKPAEKTALIRRVSYDLTGLPPSADDVDRFVADNSPQAYEKLIDRLLESPQYGEKWGRHWLDLVRYAESHGYERDSAKPEAWRFRDYVIDSFQKDKPYDRFLIEQLAGDELDDVTTETLTATGYYRLGIWDDEPADRLLARYDGLDDIVKTTAEVVLGMTMGCARCHTHKGDPILHSEYYGFLAYFHDTTPMGGANLRHVASASDAEARAKLMREKREREATLATEIAAIEQRLKVAVKEKLGAEAVGESETDKSKSGQSDVLIADSRKQAQLWWHTIEKPSNDWMETDYSVTSWKEAPGGFGQPGTPGSVVKTEWKSSDIWLRKDFEIKELPKFLSLDLHHDEDVRVFINGVPVFTRKGFVVAYERISLTEKAVKALVKGRNVIAVHCRQNGGGQYIDVGLVTSGQLDLAGAMKEHGVAILGAETVARHAALSKELDQSRKTKLPEAGTPVMSIAESGRTQTHVLLRGSPHAKGPLVEATVPAALKTQPPVIPKDPTKQGTSGKRLALAKWMTAADNPLTARVLANRLWQHHFGRGIVATPNDFGEFGERPSHPELLDWLATEVVNGGWKLKRMHKLLLLSATYQQSAFSAETLADAKSEISNSKSQISDPKSQISNLKSEISNLKSSDPLTADPSNRLLWHFNPRRLTSDELRDSILAATGELNLKAGGPSIYVPIAAEVLAGQSVPGAGWGKSSPEDQNRRSVYIHLKRSLLVPIMSLYDQADTDSSCPVRYNTTVPTQSLGMLNGEFTNGKAAQLAERLRRESPNDLAAQVRRAIRLTTSRIAANAEVTADVAFIRNLQSKRELSEEQALKMFCLLALNTNEFLYVD